MRAATRSAAEVTEQNGTACIVFYSFNIVNIITNNIAIYCCPSSEVTGYKWVGLPSKKNNLAMWRLPTEIEMRQHKEMVSLCLVAQ